MKTILSVWNAGRKGKTETIGEFAKLILASYPTAKTIFSNFISTKDDFRLVIEINGKIIGIESQGDPGTNLGNRLIDLADAYKSELIICSSRTRGETVYAVDNLYHTRGFQTIWTSTHQMDNKALHTTINSLKAKQVLELLTTLSLI